jgi:hypothetical protein
VNSSAKKWQSIPKDDPAEIGLVQVDIGGAGNQHDHRDLILKHAKEVYKDALLNIAERHDGKLHAWEGHGGTFRFPIGGPAGWNNCCRAAMEMLNQLPVVEQEGPRLTIRICCDACTVIDDPETDNLPQEFVDTIKKHGPAVSAENKVTLTERVFSRLDKPLKSIFVKRQHSNELGVDLYANAHPLVPTLAELPAEDEAPVEERATPGGFTPMPESKRATVQGWFDMLPDALKSRTMLSVGAVVVLSVMIFGLVHFWPTPPPPVPPPPWPELVQTDEWRSWRKQVHEKLSADNVTESMLADALKIKAPARPEQAAAALRRDQAIADVLMAYKGPRAILWKRFGIDEHNFLGTGLSKPFSASTNYGAASVHEYLIPNLQDDHRAVWMRILDPTKDQLTMNVQELFENDPQIDDQKKLLAKRIAERVKEKDAVSPAVIRFAILDLSKYSYSRKLGRLDAHRVFASNLAEVWTAKVRDAANLSGHTFTKGDSLYVWAFLPNHPDEVVLATWGEVLNHLPKWLSEMDKN